jgi:hypothetical protein
MFEPGNSNSGHDKQGGCRGEVFSACDRSGRRSSTRYCYTASEKELRRKTLKHGRSWNSREAPGIRSAGLSPDPKTGGRERQFAGGIGAKKVDVSFATESDGLILAVSIKSICFPDAKTKNFQKNLTNRRGDLLAEATTLHQRFPYAVVGGLFLLDRRAAADATDRRVSTFATAHEFFKTFDGRGTQTNAVERFEVLGVALFDPSPPAVSYFDAGEESEEKSLDTFLERLLVRIAERNPDRFRFVDGKIEKRSGPTKKRNSPKAFEENEDTDE